MASEFDPQSGAEKAVSVIGFGYDLCSDIRLSGCKAGPSGSRLIEIDETLTRELVFPGNIIVPNVSASIKCDKGDRTRFRSDVLSFDQMSEQFNQELSLSGRIPSGIFNAMFGFTGYWQQDAVATKSLSFDGWFITLYNIEIARSQIKLSEYVKQEVPSTWDAAALAEFIKKYGTHVVAGVKMGGKDVIYLKQFHNSDLEPTDVQKLLKQLADERYSEDVNGSLESNFDKSSRKLKDEQSVVWDLHPSFASSLRLSIVSHSKNDSMLSIRIRWGGVDNGQSHNQWLSTVSQSPNVISMSFVPIASLLQGVRGSGFVSHAINLYLRYKPSIKDLCQFLEFQLPREWAPKYGDLPLVLCKKQASPSLQFTFIGPRLKVNTVKVDSGSRPVTGMRLYLEGGKREHLAIHLHHLSSCPQVIQLSDYEPIDETVERGFFEPVNWSILSHVCTAPVQHDGVRGDDPASIVTKAWFEVRVIGMKRVLFLRLGFSVVSSQRIHRSEWEGPTSSSKNSGLISSTFFSSGETRKKAPPVVILNSALYPEVLPSPIREPKMNHFVDTKELMRGPEVPPGHWVVSGARLCVEDGKIRLGVKYSLLTMTSTDFKPLNG